MSFNLRWLGTSCFQLVLPGDVHILLDPHMDHSPNSPLTSDQIDRCDYMFLTHGHWDHVLDVGKLAERLRTSGISARSAERAAIELRDHENDRVDEALADGASSSDANTLAARKLGDMDLLLKEMQSHDELRSWAYRHPWAALVFYPLGCLALLPAVPCMESPSTHCSLRPQTTSLRLPTLMSGSAASFHHPLH